MTDDVVLSQRFRESNSYVQEMLKLIIQPVDLLLLLPYLVWSCPILSFQVVTDVKTVYAASEAMDYYSHYPQAQGGNPSLICHYFHGKYSDEFQMNNPIPDKQK